MTLNLNSNEIKCIDKLDKVIDILGGVTDENIILIIEYLKILSENENKFEIFTNSHENPMEK